MSRPTPPTFRTFFGDGERAFALTVDHIEELERLCGAGVGAIAQRLFKGGFKHADVLHTIRLGLIGGGTDPKTAASLVKIYVAGAPLETGMTLAVAILETLFFGQHSTSQDATHKA